MLLDFRVKWNHKAFFNYSNHPLRTHTPHTHLQFELSKQHEALVLLSEFFIKLVFVGKACTGCRCHLSLYIYKYIYLSLSISLFSSFRLYGYIRDVNPPRCRAARNASGEKPWRCVITYMISAVWTQSCVLEWGIRLGDEWARADRLPNPLTECARAVRLTAVQFVFRCAVQHWAGVAARGRRTQPAHSLLLYVAKQPYLMRLFLQRLCLYMKTRFRYTFYTHKNKTDISFSIHRSLLKSLSQFQLKYQLKILTY